MICLLICLALILVLVLMHLVGGALRLSGKMAKRVLPLGNRGKRPGLLRRGAGFVAGAAWGVARTGGRLVVWGIRGLLALFLPMGILELAMVVAIIATVSGGVSAFAVGVYDGKQQTQSITTQQASDAESSDSGSGEPGGFQSTANPGIKKDEWSKASKYARMAVNTGLAILQNEKLYYSWSNANGAVDCSTFTTMAVELGTGHTMNGDKVTKYKPADYMGALESHKRSDYQSYMASGPQAALYPAGSEGYIASSVTMAALPSDALPGDLLANGTHVMMFAGHRESDGKAIILESSEAGATGHFKDIAMAQPRSDMGVDQWGDSDPNAYTLFRPYVRMK